MITLNSIKRYVELRQALVAERRQIEARLAVINQALDGQTQAKVSKPVKQRRMSAAGRRHIAEAVKKRWAAARAAGKKAL